jgi:hypothetical protein
MTRHTGPASATRHERINRHPFTVTRAANDCSGNLMAKYNWGWAAFVMTQKGMHV